MGELIDLKTGKASMDEDGRVVVPPELREAMNIAGGISERLDAGIDCYRLNILVYEIVIGIHDRGLMGLSYDLDTSRDKLNQLLEGLPELYDVDDLFLEKIRQDVAKILKLITPFMND